MNKNATSAWLATASLARREVLAAVHEAVAATADKVVVFAAGTIADSDALQTLAARVPRPDAGITVLTQGMKGFSAAHYGTYQDVLEDMRIHAWMAERWSDAASRLAIEEIAGVVFVYPTIGPRDTTSPYVRAADVQHGPAEHADAAIPTTAAPAPRPPTRGRTRGSVDEPYRSRLERLRQEIDADYARTRSGHRRSPA